MIIVIVISLPLSWLLLLFPLFNDKGNDDDADDDDDGMTNA